MEGFRALVFDLDGVLLDTEALHAEAKRRAFAHYGLRVPEEWYPRFRGRSDADMVEHVVAALGPAGLCAEEVLRRKHDLFRDLHPRIAPVPGAPEFVRMARTAFAQLALTTSATPENRRFALDRLGLEHAFDVMVDADDISRTKPHPEPYLRTVELLGRSPGECLVVEDATNGVISGKAAGCAVAAITTSFGAEDLAEAGADLVFHDYAELARRLGIGGPAA